MAIYLVTQDGSPEGTKPRLIEARTSVAAIAYAARSTFAAVPLSTKEAFRWAKEGCELETATTADEEAEEAAKAAAAKKE
jgi:hypothetical protein